MDKGFDREEDDLQHRQGGQLYPIGRSLRSTFPAPDGEDLQPRITSLMVELSHQPYEASPAGSAPPRPAQVSQPSVLDSLLRFFRRQ